MDRIKLNHPCTICKKTLFIDERNILHPEPFHLDCAVNKLKNNLKANWHSYKNNRLGGVLTEIESSFGDFDDVPAEKGEQGDKR